MNGIGVGDCAQYAEIGLLLKAAAIVSCLSALFRVHFSAHPKQTTNQNKIY